MISLKNNLKTAMLLAILTALLLWVGSLFGTGGFIFAVIFVVLMNFGSYWFSHKIVLWMYRAKEAKEKDYPKLYRIVKEVSKLSGLPMPKVYIIPSQSPNAFATGRNPKNAVVAATEGIISLLDDDELKGVVAHEFAHIKNRDILISTLAGAVAGVIGYIGAMARWGAIFGFGDRDDNGSNLIELLIIGILTPLIAMIIQLAISRSREYLADETGARFVKNGKSLASALQKIEKNVDLNPLRLGNNATAHLFISSPFRKTQWLSFFMTHPPTSKRVEKLRAIEF